MSPVGLKSVLQPRLGESSSVSCSLGPHQEVSCSRQGRGRRRCRPLEVSCGGCLRRLTAGPGTSLSLASPLHPHLLPGLVCRWELEVVEVAPSSQVDLSLEVRDLSLGPEETCETSTSFLHILAGPGGEEALESEATLCGDQSQSQSQPRYQFKFSNKKHLQLRFVSGEAAGQRERRERRGFQLTISVSEVKKSHGSLKTALIVSILSAAVLLGGLICCVAAGLNMKEARGGRLGRRRARGGQEANIYMMDSSVARRLPTLPGFRFHSDNNNLHHCHEANAELDFKLYETISLQSRINSYENIRFQEYRNRVRRASLASPSVPPPPPPSPPPLPGRPNILPENTDMAPIYLSITDADKEVLDE